MICPWCYVGKRRLEKAATLAGRPDVRVRWHPFQLNPRMPREGMNRKEYRTRKFGSWEQSLALDAQVTEVGRAEGISFAFDKAERTPNTLDSHLLIQLAGREGVRSSEGNQPAGARFRPDFEDPQTAAAHCAPGRRSRRRRTVPCCTAGWRWQRTGRW